MRLFAVAAMLLAAMGFYGVLAYMVAQSTREIGIRMALGASMADALRRGLLPGMRLVLVGLALGAAGSAAPAGFLQSLLYRVSLHGWTVTALVALTLLAVAMAACLLPARRAASVDPVAALRFE